MAFDRYEISSGRSENPNQSLKSQLDLLSSDPEHKLDPQSRYIMEQSSQRSRQKDSRETQARENPGTRDKFELIRENPEKMSESRNFTLSPETTDCDSADLESELSLPSGGEGSYHSSGPRMHTSMPILEVGYLPIIRGKIRY